MRKRGWRSLEENRFGGWKRGRGEKEGEEGEDGKEEGGRMVRRSERRMYLERNRSRIIEVSDE